MSPTAGADDAAADTGMRRSQSEPPVRRRSDSTRRRPRRRSQVFVPNRRSVMLSHAGDQVDLKEAGLCLIPLGEGAHRDLAHEQRARLGQGAALESHTRLCRRRRYGRAPRRHRPRRYRWRPHAVARSPTPWPPAAFPARARRRTRRRGPSRRRGRERWAAWRSAPGSWSRSRAGARGASSRRSVAARPSAAETRQGGVAWPRLQAGS